MLKFIGFGPPESCRFCSGKGCSSCNGTGIQGNPGCLILIGIGTIVLWCAVLGYLVLK